MGFLNMLAWCAFGGLGLKNTYDNKKYIDSSKKGMIAKGSPVYFDSKGRSYYGATGEEVRFTFVNNRRVYVNARTGAIVCDLDSIEWNRVMQKLKETCRHYRVKVDKGEEWCEIDFNDMRYYNLRRVPHPINGIQTIDGYKYYRANYLPDRNNKLIQDGDWFEISAQEYKDLGGINVWGPRVTG